MTLKEKIYQDLIAAMKQNDNLARSALRLLLSEISVKEIALGKKAEGLNNEEVQQVVLREIKKRNESAEQFEHGGRPELAVAERAEAEILKNYAPRQLSDDELKIIIDDTIKSVETSGPSDMGTVMRAVMAAVAGGADGSRVSALVRERILGDAK